MDHCFGSEVTNRGGQFQGLNRYPNTLKYISNRTVRNIHPLKEFIISSVKFLLPSKRTKIKLDINCHAGVTRGDNRGTDCSILTLLGVSSDREPKSDTCSPKRWATKNVKGSIAFLEWICNNSKSLNELSDDISRIKPSLCRRVRRNKNTIMYCLVVMAVLMLIGRSSEKRSWLNSNAPLWLEVRRNKSRLLMTICVDIGMSNFQSEMLLDSYLSKLLFNDIQDDQSILQEYTNTTIVIYRSVLLFLIGKHKRYNDTALLTQRVQALLTLRFRCFGDQLINTMGEF